MSNLIPKWIQTFLHRVQRFCLAVWYLLFLLPPLILFVLFYRNGLRLFGISREEIDVMEAEMEWTDEEPFDVF